MSGSETSSNDSWTSSTHHSHVDGGIDNEIDMSNALGNNNDNWLTDDDTHHSVDHAELPLIADRPFDYPFGIDDNSSYHGDFLENPLSSNDLSNDSGAHQSFDYKSEGSVNYFDDDARHFPAMDLGRCPHSSGYNSYHNCFGEADQNSDRRSVSSDVASDLSLSGSAQTPGLSDASDASSVSDSHSPLREHFVDTDGNEISFGEEETDLSEKENDCESEMSEEEETCENEEFEKDNLSEDQYEDYCTGND